MAVEPLWIIEAKALLGTREISGPNHNPKILQMWKDIKRGGIKDDETAWCAALVGACLERSNILSTRFESAASYLDWGIPLHKPAYGAIAVFRRKGGGHVAFIVGVQGNKLVCLGGNQSNAVTIAAFDTANLVGIRWPDDCVFTPSYELKTISAEDIRSMA